MVLFSKFQVPTLTAILAFFRSPYTLLTIAMFLSASNLIVGRAMVDHVPPVALSFWRWAVAFAFLLPIAWPALRSQYRILLGAWKLLCLLGFLGIVGALTLTYAALQWTTATNASLINASVPAQIPILAWLMFRDRVTPRQALGIALTMFGVAIIVFRGDLRMLGTVDLAWGDPLILLVTLFWALYSVLLKRLPGGLHPTGVLVAVIACGLIMLLPFYVAEMASGKSMILDETSIAAILYVGVFAAAGGFLFWHSGVAKIGPNRTGVFFNLVPVFGLFLAITFLGETLYAFHVVGVPLIFTGIWLASWLPGKRA
ncbi:MAG: EamA family transporter [Rhodospirillaceae bacterium]|nr:MAG: EamA family transporter [Rhodospirillaceae bacterium]